MNYLDGVAWYVSYYIELESILDYGGTEKGKKKKKSSSGQWKNLGNSSATSSTGEGDDTAPIKQSCLKGTEGN